MDFYDLAFEYELKFGEKPPILTTLSVDDPLYLKQIKNAIDNDSPIDRNDLAEIFMTNDKVAY